MSTSLQEIKGTNGVEESELYVTIFAGHTDLVTSGAEPTRRCVQITTVRDSNVGYAQLTMSGVKELIAQLQSVIDSNYEQFED